MSGHSALPGKTLVDQPRVVRPRLAASRSALSSFAGAAPRSAAARRFAVGSVVVRPPAAVKRLEKSSFGRDARERRHVRP
jgi:hypothetical protein